LLNAGGENILIDTGPASRRGLLVGVILTHLHRDHCPDTDLFTNARILVHPTELDYAHNPARGDTSAYWYFAAMLAKREPISDGDQVTKGVSVLATPGHTKRHMAVLLETGGKKTLVAGDALPQWRYSKPRTAVQRILGRRSRIKREQDARCVQRVLPRPRQAIQPGRR
jgi:glyoxylase-like metal-dependent hydrolase (beta-lactamase superfamily II)